MNVCIESDGNKSESVKVRSSLKQGCVRTPTLFVNYLAALFQQAFDGNENGINLRIRFDGSLINLEVLCRELLFADDAAIATYSEIELQRLIDCLAEA